MSSTASRRSRPSTPVADRLAWWRRDRFGMFIHWGLYTLGDLDCWALHDMGTPIRAYTDALVPRFTGRRFDAAALAGVARAAGCRYVVMTTRHHEGYCLWNTDTTAFSSVRQTPRRDFIAEYVRAVRAAGLKVGFYFSLLDWRFKAYWDGPRRDPAGWRSFVDYVHAQVRELLTRYGRIDLLWYDGAWPPAGEAWGFRPTDAELGDAWRSRELNAMVRRLQPHIIVNNRSGAPGDYGTPEQILQAEARPWELCDTLGHYWGASRRDLDRKTARHVITRLIWCVSHGGNLLLNIGPAADGHVQPWQRRIMERVGKWVHAHGEAIYGCDGVPAAPLNNGLAPWATTRRGNTLYLHLLRYPGPRLAVATLHDYRFVSARVLDTGQPLEVRHEPTRDVLRGLPTRPPDPLATVVAVKVRPLTAPERARRAVIGVSDPNAEWAAG
jgi:alpha-L-fucosidase